MSEWHLLFLQMYFRECHALGSEERDCLLKSARQKQKEQFELQLHLGIVGGGKMSKIKSWGVGSYFYWREEKLTLITALLIGIPCSFLENSPSFGTCWFCPGKGRLVPWTSVSLPGQSNPIRLQFQRSKWLWEQQRATSIREVFWWGTFLLKYVWPWGGESIPGLTYFSTFSSSRD